MVEGLTRGVSPSTTLFVLDGLGESVRVKPIEYVRGSPYNTSTGMLPTILRVMLLFLLWWVGFVGV